MSSFELTFNTDCTNSRWELNGYLSFGEDYAHNGDLTWRGGPEEMLVFSQGEGTFTSENPNGTYISPPGYRGTLVVTSEAGSPVFKLTDHASGTVRNFFSTGYLRDITDRNGNRITFAYTFDLPGGEFFMVSMTDTQGRVTTFERAGEYKVTKMVDPAGRTHVYTYDRPDAQANLASYTDPAGKVTRYDYTGAVLGLMSRVTDPNGNATTFTYDSRDRVKSMTRGDRPGHRRRPHLALRLLGPLADQGDRRQRQGDHPPLRPPGPREPGGGRPRPRAPIHYDSNSNVIDRNSAMANKTIATYDADNNLKSSTLPTGAATTMGYTDPAFKLATGQAVPQSLRDCMKTHLSGRL